MPCEFSRTRSARAKKRPWTHSSGPLKPWRRTESRLSCGCSVRPLSFGRCRTTSSWNRWSSTGWQKKHAGRRRLRPLRPGQLRPPWPTLKQARPCRPSQRQHRQTLANDQARRANVNRSALPRPAASSRMSSLRILPHLQVLVTPAWCSGSRRASACSELLAVTSRSQGSTAGRSAAPSCQRLRGATCRCPNTLSSPRPSHLAGSARRRRSRPWPRSALLRVLRCC
mmetsp:Transcript_8241/g.24287  ORF Transcript_8241/g.24287 Transcript_8241/m.24287 type:complete len:226 (+) Transcript_8241:992-1669(+)